MTIKEARIQSDSYRKRTQAIDTLVLHYTALDLESSLRVLRYRDVSVHYVVGPDGTAYRILNNDEVGWHAGVSIWRGKTDVNARSIGVEIVNLDGNVHAYPDAQVQGVVELCKHIISENPGIKAANVVGHSDVAPKRKVDPGKLFPWRQLAAEGVCLWPQAADPSSLKALNQAQEMLEQCGYGFPHGYGIKGSGYVFVRDPNAPPAGVTKVTPVITKDIVKAFQLRFLPHRANGVWDLETQRFLEGLVLAQ